MDQVLNTSEALVAQANLLTEREQFEPAISIYRDALKLDLNNHLAFYHLGLCLDKQNRLNEAASFYQYAINLQPNFMQGYYALAELLSRQQKFAQAINCYQQLIKVSPNQPRPYMELGKTLKAKGNLNQALIYFQQVIGLKPDFFWAYIQAGSIWRQQGNYPEAVECYLQAIKINPKFQAAYTILEFIPIADQQLDQLISVYQQIVKQEPTIYQAWANLGNALTQKKQLDQALNSYQQACYYKTIISHPQLAQSYQPEINQDEPSFIIIGAGKCGTTSLYQYLSQHSQVLSPINKEINFFNFNFEQGADWYLAHFPSLPDNQNFITGEASPSYFSYLHTDRRIHSLLPQVKLIILLRNPVERAISHYYHRIREGSEKNSLEVALNSELSLIQKASIPELSYLRGYLGISMYVYKLKRWLSLFPQEQILILKSEDLYQNTTKAMAQVYSFLNLPPQSLVKYPKHNSGSYKLKNEPLKAQLQTFFKPYNQQLENLLQREFNWH